MSMTKRKLLLTAVIISLTMNGPAQGVNPLSSIPFELKGEHIHISVRVNDSGKLNFLFDTGCTEAVIDSITAHDLGLVSRGQVTDYGNGSFVESVIPKARMAIGQLSLRNIKLKKQPLKYLESSTGKDLDGVIGNEILQNYVVRIDYDKMTFELYAGDSYVYDGEGGMYSINANSFFSTIDAAITLDNGEVLMGRFLIDTGAEVTVALGTPFVNENNLLSKTGRRLECRLEARNVTMTSHQTRVRSFRIGKFEFSRPPIFLSQTEAGPLSASALSGIIGNEVLKRFNVVYDYKGQKIYLEPNHLFEEPFKVNCSGLELGLTSGNRIVIDRIFEDSPATEAGLAVGDEVAEINGSDIEKYSIHEVRDLLSRAGEKVHLLIRRGKVMKEFDLTLRELI